MLTMYESYRVVLIRVNRLGFGFINHKVRTKQQRSDFRPKAYMRHSINVLPHLSRSLPKFSLSLDGPHDDCQLAYIVYSYETLVFKTLHQKY
jgi:hypothetical protein